MIQDLRFALRSFAKAPGFTLVAVLVLAIGIGANSAMFTIVNALMFKPLSGQAGDLVGLFSHDRTRPDTYRAFSYPNYADIREQTADVFDGLMAHTFAMAGVPNGDTTRRSFVAVVSSNYFDTLGAPLAAGRTFTAEEERPGARLPVVVVGYDRWREAGLTSAFIGSQIRINAFDFTVIGVAAKGFTGTMAMATPDMWLPLGMFDDVVNDMFKNRGTGLSDRANNGLILAGRLKSGAGEAAVNARLDALSRQLEEAFPAENKNQALSIHELPRMSTSTSPRTDTGLAVASALLMAISGVVLVIACLNIANMLLARGTARTKEIAIRLAVGGARSRVVRQLVTESFLLAAAGSAAGLLIAFLATRLLIGTLSPLVPLTITFEPTPDLNVLIATTVLASIATIMFGVGPAFRISRVDLVNDLKGTIVSAGRSNGRLFQARNVLVVGQIALSLALLCSGGLFARAALIAATADPGFRYDQLLLAGIDPALAGYDKVRSVAAQRAIIDRVRAIPGVSAVAFASTVPFGEFHESMPVVAVGAEARSTEGRSPTYRIVSADYFRTLGLAMVRGRDFTAAEEVSESAPRVAIVDELLARQLFPDREPLGQMIRVSRRDREVGTGNDGEPMEIVGIAPGIKDTLFDRGPSPTLYVPTGRNFRAGLSMHVRTHSAGAETELLGTMRREVAAVDAKIPLIDLMPMRRFHDRSLELWAVRAGGNTVTSLGLLALLLAVVGVYGVKSYVVSQRTREIGIRIAVGARPRDVMGMVIREGAVLTACGLAIGLPLAGLAGMGLSRLLYEVSPLDPIVFLTAPVLLAAAALIASWLPARRAMRIAPVTALRAE